MPYVHTSIHFGKIPKAAGCTAASNHGLQMTVDTHFVPPSSHLLHRYWWGFEPKVYNLHSSLHQTHYYGFSVLVVCMLAFTFSSSSLFSFPSLRIASCQSPIDTISEEATENAFERTHLLGPAIYLFIYYRESFLEEKINGSDTRTGLKMNKNATNVQIKPLNGLRKASCPRPL